MSYFQKRDKLSVNASALESAFITGFNENPLRGYKREYFSNKERFSDSVKGKYEMFSLFKDEDIRLEASMWVWGNAHKKSGANMTAASFCQFVNDTFCHLPHLSPNYPHTIYYTG